MNERPQGDTMKVPLDIDLSDPRMTAVRLRKDLLRDGWDDRALARALRAGVLARVRHGAYADGGAWRSLTAEQRFAVRCRAAQLQSKTAVALSHAAALPFLGAPLWGLDLGEVDLTRLDGKTGRREAGVRQHRGIVLPGDLIEDDGLITTSATRAALEITTIADVDTSLVVLNDLLHRGLTTPGALRARYEQSMEHWPDSLTTDVALRLADGRIASVGETRFASFARHARLPVLEPQRKVYLPDGMLLAELDFANEELGIWFEFDGMQKYAKYLRPGETVEHAILREKTREDRVREVTGLQCMRVIWPDLDDERRLAARVWAFIARVQTGRRAAG